MLFSGSTELNPAAFNRNIFGLYVLVSGGEIGPEPVFDTVTLIISDGEAGGTDSCCHGDAPPPPVPLHGTLPVYDLNITVLPVNNKVPTVTLGKTSLSSGQMCEKQFTSRESAAQENS